MRFGDNTVSNVEAISTGSLALDLALGIIKGSSDGSGKLYFNPTANVSRQEAETMLGRLTEKGYACLLYTSRCV